MNSKIEIKNIFFNRLYNKNQSQFSNISISSTKVNNSFDNKISNINSNLYIKPHPIYIIQNKNEKHNNISINAYKPKRHNIKRKKPQKIQTYEVNYNEGNITVTKINSQKKNKIKSYNKNKFKKDGYKNNRANSYEIIPFNSSTLNIRNFFNYKYEQIKKNYNLDALNIYNYSNSKTINDKTEDSYETFNSADNTKNININTNINMNIKEINNNKLNKSKIIANTNVYNKNNKGKMDRKSSRSIDIVRLCKILKDLDNYEKGTLIKENNEKGGIISFKKDSLETRKQKYKYNYIINYKKIIFIQKWWKNTRFKITSKKKIIIIQKNFRGYKFRKNFFIYLNMLKRYNNPNILRKIIFIQKYWKNYLMNIKQNNLNFSFTNNDNDINIINNNGVIIIGSKKTKNNGFYLKPKKIINKCEIPYKIIINDCLITKKYYNNINQQINNINLIIKYFRKYLLFKKKRQNENKSQIYLKKNLQRMKSNKSRNKNIKEKNNIKKNKSLSLISYKKMFHSHSYINPRKAKIKNKKILLKESTYSSMFYKLNSKKIFSRYNINTNILKSLSNDRKNIKEINLNKIIFLQKEIKKFLIKNKYYILIKPNICYITKQVHLINNNLINKIILLQTFLKNYFKMRKSKKNDRISTYYINISTKDASDQQKWYEKNKNKNVSEFNIKENENDNIVIIKNDSKNKIKTNFISENVTTFSFEDFKDQEISIYKTVQNNQNGYENNKGKLDDKNDNDENIIEEDDDIICNNKINSIINYFTFSSKNLLLSNERKDSYLKLRNMFIISITNRLSQYLILLLNRLNFFDFIKILLQKIKKSINQYIFYFIFAYENKKNNLYNNEIFFFITLKRHILYNIYYNENNEIKTLLKDNIPKCFKIYNHFLEKYQINNSIDYYKIIKKII